MEAFTEEYMLYNLKDLTIVEISKFQVKTKNNFTSIADVEDLAHSTVIGK
jgi:hypothetical protein